MEKNKNEQLNTNPRPLRERESAEAGVLLHLGTKSQNAKHGTAVYRRRTRQRKQLYEPSELQMQGRGYKQFNQDEPRPLNTTTRVLVKCSSPARKGWGQLAAFTLAEVLITLGIIGVVAALTIPTLVANYQAKSWNTAADVFEKRLTEAIKTMNVQGKLGSYGGYSTTEGFVQELQKHFKIAKVCDNDHLMQCFEDKITMNDEEIDMTGVTKAKHFGQKDWGTNIVGLQIANGTSALIAYNPKCKANPYDNDITGSDCYAIVYDTSGYSNPNELSKDLRKSANVLNIKGFNCAFKISGTCFGQPFRPAAVDTSAMDAKTRNELGIGSYHLPDDYWGGAIVACEGAEHMASAEDLNKLANELYGTTGITGNVSNLTLNTTKAQSYGFPKGDFWVWSNQETSYYPAYRRMFGANRTDYNLTTRGTSFYYAICIGD